VQSMRVCSLCSTKVARRVSTLSGGMPKWSRQVQLTSERRREAEGKQRQRGGGYAAVLRHSTDGVRRNSVMCEDLLLRQLYVMLGADGRPRVECLTLARSIHHFTLGRGGGCWRAA